MNKIFAALVRLVSQIADFVWISKLQVMVVTILCFCTEAIANPQGFINFYLCAFIDILVIPLPETPDQLKIYSIISSFAASYPFIGFGIIFDVIGSMLFVLLFNILFRMIKFVRG